MKLRRQAIRAEKRGLANPCRKKTQMTASETPSNSSEPLHNPSMPPEAAVLDLGAALKRLGGDRGILIELAKMFAEDSPGLLDAIEQGVHQGREKDAGRAAHSLRGLAANFGAARL